LGGSFFNRKSLLLRVIAKHQKPGIAGRDAVAICLLWNGSCNLKRIATRRRTFQPACLRCRL